MADQRKSTKFVRFAWFALVYNVVVVVWGVFLRASKSGDGCGRYWLTCHGEVVPSAPELKTVIEFAHRVMSGIDLLVVGALVIWAFVRFGRGSQVRKASVVALVFIITEALIGAVLVLSGNTAGADTAARPFLAIGHLLNTFVLIGALTVTLWLASTGRTITLRNAGRTGWLFGLGAAVFLLIGASGSLAALSGMLFETKSLGEGLRQDFSSASPLLLRLRLAHPLLSIFGGVFLIFLAGWLRSPARTRPGTARWAGVLSALVLGQIVFGALTLLTHAPILMQLGHLLLADLMWIAFVLMCVTFLAGKKDLP